MFPDSERRQGRVPARAAAARLGIPRGWVLRICQEGRFPARAVRVGNDWHIEEEGVERLRRRLHRERQSPPDPPPPAPR